MNTATGMGVPGTHRAKTSAVRTRAPRPASPAKAPRRAEGFETVVHLASEYLPYAQTGGLAEAVWGVATERARAGRRTVVFLPLYQAIRAGFPRVEPAGAIFQVRLGGRTETARAYRDASTGSGRPEVFFVEVGDFFERPSIYGEEGGYSDNHLRFAFFSAAALEWMRVVVPEPAVLHAHDWHAALAPVLLRHRRPEDPYGERIGTVLTVHNAGYQGKFGPGAGRELGLEDLTHPELVEWNGEVNLLRAGLSSADLVTTVSPTHAGELLTPLGGFGLHEVFMSLGDRLKGILNGIDYSIWDPQTDPWIESNYRASNLSGKAACKRWLQRHFGLEERADLPLFAMTSRLVQQKGIELLLSSGLIPAAEAQWVFLGEGELRYKEALGRLRDSAPGRVACRFAFAQELEHKVLGGADYLLMPSLYEPCGLTQMRAQRYGAVPVVRRVGGLSDTVEDGVTGFVFGDYEPRSLEGAVRRALEAYRDRGAWEELARAGMARDFSFERGTREYEGAYARAAASRRANRESVMP